MLLIITIFFSEHLEKRLKEKPDSGTSSKKESCRENLRKESVSPSNSVASTNGSNQGRQSTKERSIPTNGNGKQTFLSAEAVAGPSGIQSCSNKEIEANDKNEKIEELVQTYFEHGKFNGSILVSHEGKLVYKKGFGLANMEWNIPNKANTKFQ